MMRVINSVDEMQSLALTEKCASKRIVLVPTMGNLHAGHMVLIDEAKKHGDWVVVSIFVNPTQFGPNEDYQRYPRTLEDDLEKCKEAGVDIVFAPSVDQMYPEKNSVIVDVKGWSARLCGASRPGHFQGVCTVVLKLFNICQPAVAVFGWKDAQQFLILRRMVRSLNVPVEMIGVETVRESDGLAKSSRNQYLSPQERHQAPALYQALHEGKRLVESGEKVAATIKSIIQNYISENTAATIDYVEIVSMNTLEPLRNIEPENTLIAAAIRLGATRLIDNIRI